MEKYLEKWKKGSNPVEETSSNKGNPVQETSFNKGNVNNEDRGKRPRVGVEFSDCEIVDDPGLRKSIDSYPYEIRDELRRRYVAKGPTQPCDHKFPQSDFGEIRRSFQTIWFKDFTWLEYSIHKDAAFCFCCYLFAEGHNHKHGDDIFTKVGFKNWKRAKEKFRKHEGSPNSPHSGAVIQLLGFRNQRHDVEHMLLKQSSQTEIDYRIQLTAVVKVIRLLLRQGLAFRGHDESINLVQRGNFLEFVKWYCEEVEEVNKVMNLNALENNQLTSPKIQKEIINACATEVRQAIVNEIGDKFISLLVDDARDSSVKEQMSIVLRFVNDNGEVVERFLGGVHVCDTSAQTLKNSIDDFFAINGLSISQLRGQCYDGTSNMHGELNGLKQKILDENKYAYYVHCFAHQLQLVLVTTSKKNAFVNSFFECVAKIVNVVGASCKRKDAFLQKHYDDLLKLLGSGEVVTGKGKNQETSLAWLLHMWDAVIHVLETIFEEADEPNSRGIARDLIEKMLQFEFVFIAHLMVNVLSKTNTLSMCLQQRTQNIATAVRMIKTIKDELEKYKNDDDCWEELLGVVIAFCTKNDIFLPNMQDDIPGRAKYHRSVDGKPKTYYNFFRQDIFFEVLDLIVKEMDDRFTESNSELLMCISCLDPRDSFVNFDRKQLLRLSELYSDDFSIADKFELKAQLNTYISYMRSSVGTAFSGLSDIGDLAKKMVEMKIHEFFNLVYRLVELALVLPVATATVERSFSAMKMIKNDLRNRIGDEFLNDSLLCYVEQEIFMSIENEDILQRFQNMQTRRIKLPC
ncbi:hypothetical protein M9H77_05387 [Catharanthus roseus]|uniref:Uncharacterized protein n=1 Tax=Catharanthus roseus TaxID=4058 RepID=A0ACC0CH03_CATRO|nr:hypothetical protein M9H77_05387 [Catharanthus roseus]